jgi:hypothetical protein
MNRKEKLIARFPIMLHKPHPSRIMKHYQLKQIKEVLGL